MKNFIILDWSQKQICARKQTQKPAKEWKTKKKKKRRENKEAFIAVKLHNSQQTIQAINLQLFEEKVSA